MSKPKPKFEVEKMVDAFGVAEIIESRHYSEMWDEWFYKFKHAPGRTPESELSEIDSDTIHKKYR